MTHGDLINKEIKIKCTLPFIKALKNMPGI